MILAKLRELQRRLQMRAVQREIAEANEQIDAARQVITHYQRRKMDLDRKLFELENGL